MIGLSTKSINSSKRDLLKRAEENEENINGSSFQIESFVLKKKNPTPCSNSVTLAILVNVSISIPG